MTVRPAAPMAKPFVIALLVLPAAYAMWRRGQVHASMAASQLAGEVVSVAEVAYVEPATNTTPDAAIREAMPDVLVHEEGASTGSEALR